MTNEPVISGSRGWALVGLVVCAALLGTAVAMTPDSRGLGSHEQLGLPPCGMLV